MIQLIKHYIIIMSYVWSVISCACAGYHPAEFKLTNMNFEVVIKCYKSGPKESYTTVWTLSKKYVKKKKVNIIQIKHAHCIRNMILIIIMEFKDRFNLKKLFSSWLIVTNRCTWNMWINRLWLIIYSHFVIKIVQSTCIHWTKMHPFCVFVMFFDT